MTEHRSGFVAIVGRPNAGKSTLINALLGQKVAAVSPRPQTTRRRQLGILSREDAQLVFVDTPGLHNPRHKLGEFLNQEAAGALDGVDVIVYLADASSGPNEDDTRIAGLLNGIKKKSALILALNKIDLIPEESLPARLEAYRGLLKKEIKIVSISAARGDGLTDFVNTLVALCPVRPPEYDEEQVTDLYEREIAGDLIREAALLKLRDEVPHSLAVRVDEFTERPNGMAYIAATIFVERDSQKGIVIGQGGKMLKGIGSAARQQIEQMGGRKVFLELRVKVEKDWRNNENVLNRFGYKIKQEK